MLIRLLALAFLFVAPLLASCAGGTGGSSIVPTFQEKGMRAMPATWRNIESTMSFLEYAKTTATPRMAGYMFTTWAGSQDMLPALLEEKPADRELPTMAVEAVQNLQAGMRWTTHR